MRMAHGLLPFLVGCSCASSGFVPRRPDGGIVEARSGNGRVLCSNLDQIADAAKAALAIDRYFTPAGEKLGYLRSEPVEVWLDAEWPRRATTLERCIVFNPSDGGNEFADLILAHEFVHWHAEDTRVQRNLPHTILEGICEWIAANLVSQWLVDRRKLFRGLLDAARERGDLPHLISRLSLNKHEWRSHPSDDRLYEQYALGFMLVDRIGVDVLREAAEMGPVTPNAILEMAGISADGTGL